MRDREREREREIDWLTDLSNLEQKEAWSTCAKSTNKGVSLCSKGVTQTQQQRPQLPTVALNWQTSKHKGA